MSIAWSIRSINIKAFWNTLHRRPGLYRKCYNPDGGGTSKRKKKK